MDLLVSGKRRALAFILPIVLLTSSLFLSACAHPEASDEDDTPSASTSASLPVPAAVPALSSGLEYYDAQLAAEPQDPQIYLDAIKSAEAAHDLRRDVHYRELYSQVRPDDMLRRIVIPQLYLKLGDSEKFNSSRLALKAFWESSSSPAVQHYQMFPVEIFALNGEFTVLATECFKQTGDFGVSHRFDIFEGVNRPHSMADLKAFIVLEHNLKDYKIARELNPGTARIIPSLDALTANGHETLGFLKSEPPYTVMRQFVIQYIARHQGLAASPSIRPGQWGIIRCGAPASTG